MTVALDARDGRAVVVFGDALGRALPLWVDDADAAAIAAAARGDKQTTTSASALLWAAVSACGGSIDRVELRRIQGGVLRAVVAVVGVDGPVEFAARASVAVAVALVAGAPIFADEAVLDALDHRLKDAAARAAIDADVAVDEPVVQSTADRWNALLAHLAERVHDERPS
jgi:bifunctional DNase/RNase